MRLVYIISLVCTARGFTTAPLLSSSSRRSSCYLRSVDFDSLMDMDVVIYSEKDTDRKLIGAVQEDGTLSPLSAWSSDPAFGDSIEFVVDEEDRPGLNGDEIVVHSMIPEDSLSYGSRQVGGGKGPGNPHGEESELLYYITQDKLGDIELKINPDLEILW
eukprot:scaffold7349_cov173-Amphora_coffeaeformis.AAC.67